jgi:RNA polymerase sigma-70 factor (ECF subfamily)
MAYSNEHRSQVVENELLEHITRLRAFAVSLCGDSDRGNDLVQETLLKALNNLDSYKVGTNLGAWLFTILRNTYLTQIRRGRWVVRDEDGVMTAAIPVPPPQESHLELLDLEKALRHLNGEQREALILVGAAGFSYEEAAEICGCCSGTVKSRVNRARDKLYGTLYEESPDRLRGGQRS